MINTIHSGLEGIIVDTTKISEVIPEKSFLIYYGYRVQDLAEHCSFEEVAYLLLNGNLPNKNELSQLMSDERSQRDLSDRLLKFIDLVPYSAHPMDVLRSAVSFLATEDSDVMVVTPESVYKKAIALIAKIPTIVAASYRHRNKMEIIAPRDDLSLGENFFYMCFGSVPSAEIISAFDVSMILYAEHTFNASTFTARVITSSLSDIYSAVSGAIGSLRGPLHGGANEEVMKMFIDIGDVSHVDEWMNHAFESGKKIMGFGHRVYKKGDSRVPTMKKYMIRLSELKEERKWVELYEKVESVMLKEKNIYPNLDFPTGPAYYLMGFDMELYTPIFVISRITGWSAHIMEQLSHNRLIRPISEYSGPNERNVIPINER